MELIANILLISGTVAATAYCFVLSRRLRRFTDLEKGVGGAIAVLSAQVDDMSNTLRVAQVSAVDSTQPLGELTSKAEMSARKLELLAAAMHDLPDPAVTATNPPEPRHASSVPQQPAEPAVEPLFLSHRNQIRDAAE